METTAVPVAVVTGAAQGIGRRVAEALAGEGMRWP
jgi:NAD(P)-dependent dehydrogenase (short-subunit alcohol dehydrogenase family)